MHLTTTSEFWVKRIDSISAVHDFLFALLEAETAMKQNEKYGDSRFRFPSIMNLVLFLGFLAVDFYACHRI